MNLNLSHVRVYLEIQVFNYSSHLNANNFNRLPLPETLKSTPVPAETILTLKYLEEIPITTHQIKQWTNQDPLFFQVKNLAQEEWSSENSYLKICLINFRPSPLKQRNNSLRRYCNLKIYIIMAKRSIDLLRNTLKQSNIHTQLLQNFFLNDNGVFFATAHAKLPRI